MQASKRITACLSMFALCACQQQDSTGDQPVAETASAPTAKSTETFPDGFAYLANCTPEQLAHLTLRVGPIPGPVGQSIPSFYVQPDQYIARPVQKADGETAIRIRIKGPQHHAQLAEMTVKITGKTLPLQVRGEWLADVPVEAPMTDKIFIGSDTPSVLVDVMNQLSPGCKAP